MAKVEKSIDIGVPVHAAYNEWTRFEDYPKFMDGVREVRQIDGKRLHWKTDVGGTVREWDAEILEQTPDRVLSWHNTTGMRNLGQVSFQQIDNDNTRVTLMLDSEVETGPEKGINPMNLLRGIVETDLGRFKQLIELRSSSTTPWRKETGGPHGKK